jgi:alpha-tubulin suppressor-like RCC1 family protein
LSAGAFHTCGVTPAHVAYCWGNNSDGQLGNPPYGSQTCAFGPCIKTPVAVSGGLAFLSVSAATYHTCGITTTGAAYCWGDNTEGWLGNGSTTASTTPVGVTGGLAFSAVSAGQYHTCGVTAAGAAHCWGDNRSGQLGNGTTAISSSTPVPVSGGLTFAAVSAGALHNCGATAAGAAYCWGDNRFGQLGNGTTANSSTPVPVSGGLTFAAVNTGHMSIHSCGVTGANVAYCWGGNSSAQLGDGTITDRSTPVAAGH